MVEEQHSTPQKQRIILDLPNMARNILLEIQGGYPGIGKKVEARKLSAITAAGITEDFICDAKKRRLIIPELDHGLGLVYLSLTDVTLLFLIKRYPLLKTSSSETIAWDKGLSSAVRGVIDEECLKIESQTKKPQLKKWKPNWY